MHCRKNILAEAIIAQPFAGSTSYSVDSVHAFLADPTEACYISKHQCTGESQSWVIKQLIYI